MLLLSVGFNFVGDTFIVSISDKSVFLFAIVVAVGVAAVAAAAIIVDVVDVVVDDWDEDITAGTFIVTDVVVDEFNAVVRLFGSTNVTDVTISSSSVAVVFIAAFVAVSLVVTLGVVAFPFCAHWSFSIVISFKIRSLVFEKEKLFKKKKIHNEN